MPEGPEVKKVVDKLKRKLIKKNLININILNGRYKKKEPSNWNKLLDSLPLNISKISCKGKFIYIEFYDTDLVLFNTLGMSGYWFTLNELNQQLDSGYYSKKHNNIEFIFEDNVDKQKKYTYYFNDMRNFGTLIVSDKEDLNNKLNTLGIDVLNPKNEFNEFKIKLCREINLNKMIGSLLLNQTIVAGCGNYMRAEVLYFAKVNPYTFVKDLTDKNLKDIYKYLKKVAYIFYNKKLGIKYGILTDNDKLIKLYKTERVFLIYGQDYGPNGEKIISNKMEDRTIHYVL